MTWVNILDRLRSFDSETYRFRPGELAPPLVCSSSAQFVNGQPSGALHVGAASSREVFERFLSDPFAITAFANASYDLAVLAQRYPDLMPLIFKALREGKIFDVLIAEALNAIFHGHLFQDPNTGKDLRSPTTNKVTNRYSLEIVTHLLTGRADAKKNDVWRSSYALLDGIPEEEWPHEAKIYPIDDADNTIVDAAIQILGKPRPHEWQTLPAIPGVAESTLWCRVCQQTLGPSSGEHCPAAERSPHRNLNNMVPQVEAAFALHLGAAWSLRTDGERVEALALEVEGKHHVAQVRYQAKGWIREDGTEDGAAIKRAIAIAYGVPTTATCKRCDGTGRVRNTKMEACRGEKLRGRFQGCQGFTCGTCGGSTLVPKLGNEVICKNVYEDGSLATEGCDGSGLDLSSAVVLPRTDKEGIKTDRDTLEESGNDDLEDYGANEFEKSYSTYVPYLRKGIPAPLPYSPNVLVATGRCSYEGSPIHQFPREGKERECVRARGWWCGSFIEYVLSSTDYEAGELCTLAQYLYWHFGYSSMRDVINRTGKPGILHSDLAAQVMGITLDEFLVRLKAKDKMCVLTRQASKPFNFGKPAGMGAPKIVLTNRKRAVGFTVCEDGPTTNRKGEPGYNGIRFCILLTGAKSCGTEKITEWGKKKRPCAPVCKACVEAVEYILTPVYMKRYPEMKDYFTLITNQTKRKEPAVSYVWDAQAQKPRVVRERGGCDFTAQANNGFQSLLADIGKDAFVTATRECYLGVADDGEESPLAGSRLVLFAHDEPIGELIANKAHLAGPRIAEIMMASGRKMAPDVVWKAETALAYNWYKAMEPVYENGKLIPWVPNAT